MPSAPPKAATPTPARPVTESIEVDLPLADDTGFVGPAIYAAGEWILRTVRRPAVQVFAASALAMLAIVFFAPHTTLFATLETLLTAVNTIAASFVYVRFLCTTERFFGKKAPIRIASIVLSEIPVWYACQGPMTIVEPGLILVPATSWLGLLAETMLVVPILATIADVLGWSLENRGSVRMRMGVIAGVCGVAGLLAGGYVLSGFYTTEETWRFDLFVAVPSIGAVIIAAMIGTALAAARRALPEPVAERGKKRDELAGEYRILRPLGHGGMGEVFLAQRIGPHGFQRPVVLKRIVEASSKKRAAVERFFEEARIAASLQHPNVIAVHDLGRLEKGGWYLAMEYVAGLTVRDVANLLVHRGQLTPAEAIIAVGEQACRGLTHAHERGVIHRDVSPHNLMVSFEGVVKVLDFGVAKAKRDAEPSLDGTSFAPRKSVCAAKPRRAIVTQAGKLVGKLTYLPPEQFRGRGASAAGDVFSLGVTLYELATGRHPYGREQGKFPVGEEPGDLVPLSRARPDLPRELCAAIDQALAFDPWNRFKSTAEMERALSLAKVPAARFDLGDWLKGLAPADWEEISLDAPLETATAPHRVEGTVL